MDTENGSQPVIITCKFEDEVEEYFNSLRQQYFPTAKNLVKAHLTLFHHILMPAENVLNLVKQNTLNTKPFDLSVERITFTGRGVAVVITSDELMHLHKNLQQVFKAVLTPQDKQGLWPHITIQNKASVSESKALAIGLQQRFKPFTATVIRLELFYYLNGPWKVIDDVYFK